MTIAGFLEAQIVVTEGTVQMYSSRMAKMTRMSVELRGSSCFVLKYIPMLFLHFKKHSLDSKMFATQKYVCLCLCVCIDKEIIITIIKIFFFFFFHKYIPFKKCMVYNLIISLQIILFKKIFIIHKIRSTNPS